MSPRSASRELSGLSLALGLGFFATALANPGRLARLPLQSLLKGDLMLDETGMSVFIGLAGLSAYLGPLAAVLSDYVPIMGTHRRHYLIFTAFGGATLWAAAAVMPRSYGYLLATMFALNTLYMLGSTVVGGLLVDCSRRHDAAGRLSAIRSTVSSTTTLIVGPISGWLAGRAFAWTCASAGGLLVAMGVCTALFVREAPQEASRQAPTERMGAAVLRSLRNRDYQRVALFYLAFRLTPSFGFPLYYHQTDVLGLSNQTLGWLGALNCGGGVLGGLCYGQVVCRFRLRGLLLVGVAAQAACMLIYLGYDGMRSALVIEPMAGFLVTVANLPLIHMVVRVSPRESGALAFALLLSLGQGALSLANWFGAALTARLGLEFAGLVWICGAAAAAMVLLVPLLPSSLLGGREGDGEATQR